MQLTIADRAYCLRGAMYKAFKWMMDRLLALVAIALLSPVFLLLMLAIVLDSKGGPFFVQKRDGYKKKTIKVIKFRTMFSTDFAFDIDHPVVEAGDPRVTRVGGFLRRTKLDELPQLINILKGDMSFVGPRPLLPVYTPRYERWEFQKFAVRPGLTGLPQVKGNGYLSVQSRSYYDALYTEQISLWTDFKIILLTVGVILFGEERFKKEATREEIEALKSRYQPTVETPPEDPSSVEASPAEIPSEDSTNEEPTTEESTTEESTTEESTSEEPSKDVIPTERIASDADAVQPTEGKKK